MDHKGCWPQRPNCWLVMCLDSWTFFIPSLYSACRDKYLLVCSPFQHVHNARHLTTAISNGINPMIQSSLTIYINIFFVSFFHIQWKYTRVKHKYMIQQSKCASWERFPSYLFNMSFSVVYTSLFFFNFVKQYGANIFAKYKTGAWFIAVLLSSSSDK